MSNYLPFKRPLKSRSKCTLVYVQAKYRIGHNGIGNIQIPRISNQDRGLELTRFSFLAKIIAEKISSNAETDSEQSPLRPLPSGPLDELSNIPSCLRVIHNRRGKFRVGASSFIHYRNGEVCLFSSSG